jgi:hypothetical protein
MLLEVEAVEAETARLVEEEAGTLEVERVEPVDRRVQISTAEVVVEAEAKERWWPL